MHSTIYAASKRRPLDIRGNAFLEKAASKARFSDHTEAAPFSTPEEMNPLASVPASHGIRFVDQPA